MNITDIITEFNMIMQDNTENLQLEFIEKVR